MAHGFASALDLPQTPALGALERAHAACDEELMARFRDSAQDADFNELARRYSTRSYRLALGMLGCPTAAEDAVQECFLHVLRSRARYQPGMPFAQWLFTILRNICRDECRSRAPRPGDPLAERGCGRDPQAALEAQEEFGLATQALARLSTDEREALTLRIYGGLDFAAIAQACRVSPDVAKKRVYRALERLRRELTIISSYGSKESIR